MKKQILATLACMGFALASQAATITWTFSAGTGDTGSSSGDFVSSGTTLHAESSGDNLFLKNGGGDEQGLGLTDGANDSTHEIQSGEYIAFKLPTVPSTSLNLILAGSLTGSDAATILFGATKGAGAPVGTFDSSHNSVDVTLAASANTGWLTILGTGGDLLLTSVSATAPNVPDGGMTVAMLGGALTLLGLARRKLIA